MTRIVLGIEYDGSGYAGWQWQTEQKTLQSILEQALSKVANQAIHVVCAGRTDAGVHALEQVVHFDSDVDRTMHSWLMGGNINLPDDIKIIWVQPAVANFHARYSAIARFYRYVIYNRPVVSALLRQQVTHCYEALDEKLMHKAAQHLIGDHDFSSFRAQGCQSKSPRRMMYFIEIYRNGERVIMDICANAFVHHMVRNIAGVLMAVGMGKQSVDWPEFLLATKDRKQSGVTASPYGLYLGGIYYPEHYGIIKNPIFARLPTDACRFD